MCCRHAGQDQCEHWITKDPEELKGNIFQKTMWERWRNMTCDSLRNVGDF